MTKYGVVGTGYFGAELARFMSKVEGAKITAIYDPVNAAPIAKELNCVATATMEALCSHPDVDWLHQITYIKRQSLRRLKRVNTCFVKNLSP